MSIDVIGAKEAKEALKKLGDQFPVALKAGMNRTMAAVEQAELNAMERTIDKPIPWTLNAFRILLAKEYKGTIDSVLYIQPNQAKYLTYAIKGGTVASTLVPVIGRARLNASGNIPAKRRRGLAGATPTGAGRRGIFIGRPGPRDSDRLPFGLWRRAGRDTVQLIAKHAENQRREKRYPFYETAEKVAGARLDKDIVDAVKRAIERI